MWAHSAGMMLQEKHNTWKQYRIPESLTVLYSVIVQYLELWHASWMLCFSLHKPKHFHHNAGNKVFNAQNVHIIQHWRFLKNCVKILPSLNLMNPMSCLVSWAKCLVTPLLLYTCTPLEYKREILYFLLCLTTKLTYFSDEFYKKTHNTLIWCSTILLM